MAPAGWKAYAYNPSMGAAIIFIILFGATTLVHTWRLFGTRTWFFIPIMIGGYCTPSPFRPSTLLLMGSR
jgi:hypothetical protein